MNEEKLVFPSQEWIERYKQILNENADYEDAAKDWEGDFIFEVEADGEIIEEPISFYLDLWHGKCRGAEMVEGDKSAEFTYSGPYKNWKLLFEGEIGPIRGLMARKFELQGSMSKIMRYTKAASELVSTATKVPTKYIDE
ncbi:MAG: SCP2 sterol-binding domain-containing protein [Candidatus Thorarchaeota archaeon]|nr:SCP2 sterol-binding domain-containing protein [Candidatus Thorarchaeota archaeon]